MKPHYNDLNKTHSQSNPTNSNASQRYTGDIQLNID